MREHAGKVAGLSSLLFSLQVGLHWSSQVIVWALSPPGPALVTDVLIQMTRFEPKIIICVGRTAVLVGLQILCHVGQHTHRQPAVEFKLVHFSSIQLSDWWIFHEVGAAITKLCSICWEDTGFMHCLSSMSPDLLIHKPTLPYKPPSQDKSSIQHFHTRAGRTC